MQTDRKTENSSEKPNNCEDFFREPTAEERKAVADYIDSISVPTGVNIFDLMDEPTISKMEQVDKDINVRSKDEPTHNQHVQRVEYVGNDERSRCWTCKHFERMHETPISSDGSYYTYVVCTASECRYEPQTDEFIESNYYDPALWE